MQRQIAHQIIPRLLTIELDDHTITYWFKDCYTHITWSTCKETPETGCQDNALRVGLTYDMHRRVVAGIAGIAETVETGCAQK